VCDTIAFLLLTEVNADFYVSGCFIDCFVLQLVHFFLCLGNLIRKFPLLGTPFSRLSTNSSARLRNFEDKRSVLILTYVTYYEVHKTYIIKLIII
jgi:hypothetical protein